MENKKQGEEIKIVDKRRFDNEGKPKESAKDEGSCGESCGCTHTEKASSSNKKEKQQSSAATQAGGTYTVDKIDFNSFIMSIATQAMMALGDIEPPEGMDVKKDKAAAKQMIDIIGMLQEKTKNNLAKEEEEFVEEILHNLRLRYVALS